ncbi:uncharacterized protein IWZ02DRAFT_235204 [Phyllosticta citriasiana]|uniref:Uncharacterized protein n=1 Tax=Phyllosticta citriasiana TaxID=595635 RepID=A0ABR1KPU1_9PEZI
MCCAHYPRQSSKLVFVCRLHGSSTPNHVAIARYSLLLFFSRTTLWNFGSSGQPHNKVIVSTRARHERRSTRCVDLPTRDARYQTSAACQDSPAHIARCMICRSRAWRPGTQPCLLPLSPGLRLDDKSGSVIVDHESVGPLLAHRTRPSALGHSVDVVPWCCQVVDAETVQVLRCPSRQPANAACDLRPGAAAVVQVIEQPFCSSMGVARASAGAHRAAGSQVS